MSAEAERKTENLPEWKREEVAAIEALIEDHENVGVVGITGIPSRQLQEMRRELHGVAVLRVSRNTLIERAISSVDEGVEALLEYVDGEIGLVATDENPFVLFRELEASKTPAPIGAGEISPNDIVIPAGDTGMDPGPFVGELQQVGANARIEDGSIKVVETATVLSAGEEVSADLANVLNELEIEAKEVGLNLRGVYADEVLFEPADLDIDIEAYERDIGSAAAGGRNLAINAGIYSEAVMPAVIAKATARAKSLGIHAAIESPDFATDLLSTADAQVRALAGLIDDPDALPESLQSIDPAPSADAHDEEEEQTDERDETEEADDQDGDDDDDGGAEGLGEMFG